MSKRRRNVWDDEAMEFQGGVSTGPEYPQHMHEYDEMQIEPEFLDEAHEALSRLFTKTSKRAKQLKGLRRKDAWH